MKKVLVNLLQRALRHLDGSTATGNLLTPAESNRVLAVATLGFFDWNLVTNRFVADDNWLAILGYRSGELLLSVDSLHSLVHPDDADTMQQQLFQAIGSGEQFVLEFRGVHKLGHLLWIRTIGIPVERDPQTGAARRLCGAMQDITQVKIGERERNEYLQFFEMASDLMMIGEIDGKFLKVNRATLDTLGYTEQEMYTINMMDIAHPDDRLVTMAEFRRQMQTGQTFHFENRVLCKDGSYRWLSYRSTFMKDIGLSYATARDITNSRRILEELRQHQERYSALVNNTDDVIMEFDRQHRHIYVNDVVTRVIGMQPEQFIGRTHEEMGFPQHLCELWEDAIERVFVSGKPCNIYFEAENPGGNMKVDWSVFPGLVVDGEVKTVLNVSRDITQYLKMEEELRRMQKLSSLGVLAGGIAHDFNNILTILFGNIALAQGMLPEGHPGRTALDKADIAFQRATHLTGQLLTFAKGGEPVKQDVSIGAEVAEAIRFDLSGSNVKLVFEAPDDLWRARVDKGQISQVFSNLATNALQAMPLGGHLYVGIGNCEVGRGDVAGLEPGSYLKFRVRDEGTGIQAEHLDKIFDPYFTTKNKGSGLGLATVHSIVSRHGGHISVESEPGKGTLFTLYLPASGDETPVDLAAPAPLAEPERRPARVLLMDDEDMICDLCTTFLNGQGYRVFRARDGHEAIGMFKEARGRGENFDCMIMDLTIPGGMSGKEALAELLKLDPEIKAIVSSGYAADPVMANYREYGFRGCMPKPFKLAALNDELRRILAEE